MNSEKDWKIFEATGKIDDYLRYSETKKVTEAREKFVSMIEGESKNGRDNNSNGNSDFFNGYK